MAEGALTISSGESESPKRSSLSKSMSRSFCRACQDGMPPCTLFELVIRVAIVVFMEQLASGVIAERPNEGQPMLGT